MHKLNNIKRFLAFLAAAAAVAVVVVVAVRMQRSKAPAPLAKKLPLQVDVSLQRVHYTETKQGVKQWDLSAEKAEYNREHNRTYLAGVKLVLLESPAGELQVTAARADYDNATRNVELVGNVHGVGSKGIEFFTESVTYVAARSQLESAKNVRFTDAGLSLEGKGMKFQTKTRKLQMVDVTAECRPGGRK